MTKTKQISTFYYQLIIGILFSCLPISFCFSQDFTLNSQLDVDAFDPLITTITGNLIIRSTSISDPISDLSALSNITSIGGDLRIYKNDVLPHIDAFNSLNTIGGELYIYDNSILSQIDGLINLTSIGGDLSINNHPLLLHIDGLSNLTSIGGYLAIFANSLLTEIDALSNIISIGEGISIEHNHTLVQIDALSNITSISGNLQILSNYALSQIEGLNNITSISGYLSIFNNDALTDCCPIQLLLSTPGAIGGSVSIFGNPSECSSEMEILDACGLTILTAANPPCIGAGNGSIQVFVTSTPTPPYTYSWTRLEDGQTDSGSSDSDNFSIDNLAAGTYDLIVINVIGDILVQNNIVLIPISGSVFEILEITTTNSSNNINNGSISISIGGGMPPYDYSWSGPVSGSENNSDSLHYTIPNLSQGTYTIIISEAGGLQQTVDVYLLDETVPVFPCTEPLDVVILNDVSGSVDAMEYAESKAFFVDFVNAMNIGSGADDSRASIFEWADNQSIEVPMTDNLADLQNYINNTRAFSGGTNPQDALVFGKDYLESNARPDVQGVLILSTDGTGGQISPSLVALADQYKAAGYHIVTIAFDAAFSDTYTRNILQQVASIDFLAPGALAYSQLDQDLAENIVTLYLCPIDPGSSATAYFNRDGAIDIISIDPIGDCPMPDYVEITFTIEALQQLSIPSGTPISFYNNNPALFGATPILTWQIPCAIPAGTTETFTVTLPLNGPSNIFAVLNDDGSQAPPVMLPVTDIEELAYSNNIDNETVCTDPLPTLQAFKYTTTPQPICNNTVIYTVDVCNISALDATGVEIMDVPPANFVLLGESLNLNGCSIPNGTTFDIPAGCCVSITYTYDASNAAYASYNNQDVLLSGPGGQIYIDFDGASTSAEDVTIDGTIDCPSTTIDFTKSVNVSESCEDAFVVYTFTIDNQLNIPLQGISFSDILPSPATWTFQPYSLSGLSIANSTISGGSATFTIDQVEANTVASFSIDAYLGDWTMDGVLSNTVTLENVPDLVNGGFQTLNSNTVNTGVSASPEISGLPDSVTIDTNEDLMLTAILNTMSSIFWTTSGDGIFSDANSASTDYIPGQQDLLNGGTIVYISSISLCGSDTDSVSVTIMGICPNLEIELFSSNISCKGENDGIATVNISTGTAPYTYEWSNGGSDSITTNLVAGQYLVTVTDANACTGIDSISISEPDAISISLTANNNACFGENDGSIEFATTIGGVAPYLYAIDGITFSNQTLYSFLSSGTYTAYVQDANACIFEETVSIDEAEELITNIDIVNDISCTSESNGAAEAIVSGGNPPYSYNWSNGEVIPIIENLEAGNYNLSVTDANACTVVENISISHPDPMLVSITANNSLCFGDNDGSIRFDEIQGGTPPYLYTIDGEFFSTQTQFNELALGTYMVAVQDANSCIYEQTVIIDEAAELVLSLGLDTIIPLGDSLLVHPDYNVIVVDTFIWIGVDCINCPEVTVAPASALNISLTIADLNGCLASDDLLLRVDTNTDLYVPNVFSPNNDGLNDWLFPQTAPQELTIKEFLIFNRWGGVVFERHDFEPNDSALGWDGTFKGQLLQSGVFVWYAKTTLLNGEEKFFKGDVVLVR